MPARLLAAIRAYMRRQHAATSGPTGRQEEGQDIKRILITGANKGIGLATARAALGHSSDVQVLLCSRDRTRGQAALDALVMEQPAWESRLEFLEVDVTSDDSVALARDTVAQRFGTETPPLYGVVNNAGIGLGSADIAAVVNVNTLGVMRICEAFVPLLEPSGRIANVSSASGPKFVSQCSIGKQRFFQDAEVSRAELADLVDSVIELGNDAAGFRSLGLGENNAYGFSKACVSLYTMILARQYPQLHINACTPGYIETDLTRPQAESRGVAPSELGMKSTTEGTVAILHLLFGKLQGNGHYYGSDAKRSPLDRYRAPGTPEYTGD